MTPPHLCPRCDPRKFLLTVQRVANVVEDLGLTDEQIDERVDWLLEKRPKVRSGGIK